MPCDYGRACLSPQGLYAACGSGDGNVYVWHAETTLVQKVLTKGGHDGYGGVRVTVASGLL